MNPQHIVKGTGDKLKAHALGKITSVYSSWMQLQWRVADSGLGDAAAMPENEPAIRLFPQLQRTDFLRAQAALLREFGLIILRKSGAKGQAIWRHKLGLPSSTQIDSFQSKLESPDIRKNTRSYRELVESYPRAVDRLVALNLANALIANHVPYRDSEGVKIRQWGPTLEYATLQRYHTLAAIAPAYTPTEFCSCFGKLFAECVLNDMQAVSESSVAQGLRDLVTAVSEKAA